MRFVIGMILFWITVLALNLFLIKKCKIDKKIVFPAAFTIIGLYEFLLGIINQMKIGSLILVILALGYLAYLVIKRKIDYKEILNFIKNPINILLILCFIYITVIGYNMHLTHYDNFSHWGLIVKSMFKTNMLPNFEQAYIDFKGYQPGSACFIYFFCLLAGKKEGMMIIAQNYLIFAYFSVLFSFIGKEKRLFKALLLVALYIFIMTTSLIPFNNLLVDSLVALCFVYLICIGFTYKDNLKKLLLFAIPTLIFLFLIKNIGLILDGFFCLYLLYLSLKDKKFKKGINYVIIIGLILVATLLVWQGHVSAVFGKAALESKHSLSPQNIIKSINVLGKDNILLFIKIYGNNILNLKDNIANIYMLCINIVTIPLLFLTKDKKGLFKHILVLDVLYLLYWLILGFLYILSMPWNEAKVLASYSRYMMTIIIAIYSLYALYILKMKDKKILNTLFVLLLAILLLIPIHYNKRQAQTLIGVEAYKDSKVEKFDSLLQDIPKNKNIYYIYSPSSEKDAGFLGHLAKYKLCKSKVYTVYSLEEANFSPDSYLVLFDKIEDESLLEEYEKINDTVYLVKEKEE